MKRSCNVLDSVVSRKDRINTVIGAVRMGCRPACGLEIGKPRAQFKPRSQ
jgi:hypothetical protein